MRLVALCKRSLASEPWQCKRMIDKQLIRLIRDQFALQWTGVHGAPHRARVRENGLRLTKLTAANEKVIELFAFLNDSKRLNNNRDPERGPLSSCSRPTVASYSCKKWR